MHVSVMLKQKIKAGGIKIKRYDERHQHSNKINSFELTRTSSMKLWMKKKEKGQNNLTQLKQPPFGERYGRKRLVTMSGLLG